MCAYNNKDPTIEPFLNNNILVPKLADEDLNLKPYRTQQFIQSNWNEVNRSLELKLAENVHLKTQSRLKTPSGISCLLEEVNI